MQSCLIPSYKNYKDCLLCCERSCSCIRVILAAQAPTRPWAFRSVLSASICFTKVSFRPCSSLVLYIDDYNHPFHGILKLETGSKVTLGCRAKHG